MMEITFVKIEKSDYNDFCADVCEIFSFAVIETFGKPESGKEIIEHDEILGIISDPECETYAVYADGIKVGGISIKADAATLHNSAELFYIYPEYHGKGLGYQIWQAIERLYPNTKVWRLITPYFEKRNIHFYVNKCGFKIVEFFNKAHTDPARSQTGEACHDEYFVFEKLM
ncbi:MAG: GNAT family N-acetyltransferase [Bacteroidaceae bacterium]|nr:GNAT family N-acetyltransferase [Bacteroidaceae bacterium]